MVAAAHLQPYRAYLNQQGQDRLPAPEQRRGHLGLVAQTAHSDSTGGSPWALTPQQGDPRFAAANAPGYQQYLTDPRDAALYQERQARSYRDPAYEQYLAEVHTGQRPQAPVSGVPALERAAALRQQGLQLQPLQHFASRGDEAAYAPDGSYSPYAFGGTEWRDGLQRHVPNIGQRLFNREGQLNAQDKRDALTQIMHILQGGMRDVRNPRFYRRQASPQELEERRQVLAAAVQDQEGFRVLGQELLLPVKEIADYEAFVRRIYRQRALQQGEYFRMAKDVRSTAWVIGQDGQGVESRLGGRYVTPSEFKIGSFPTVDIEDIYLMNFDVLDRAQDTARQEIELEEDKRGIALLDTLSQAVNTPTTFGTLGIGAFEDVRYMVERHRLVVEHFLINRAELSDIVKTMSAAVDPVTERELILAGYIGSILNATIMTSAGTGVEEVIPAGTFYACVGPDYLGEMGTRIELFSEPFNMFAQFRFVKGWAMGELLGFVSPSGKGVAKGVK